MSPTISGVGSVEKQTVCTGASTTAMCTHHKQPELTRVAGPFSPSSIPGRQAGQALENAAHDTQHSKSNTHNHYLGKASMNDLGSIPKINGKITWLHTDGNVEWWRRPPCESSVAETGKN